MPPQQPPYTPYPQPTPGSGQSPQLPPQPLPDPKSPYEFIMNPAKQKRSGFSPGNPKGLLFIVGAIALVAMLLVLIFSLFSSGGENTKPYLSIAREQQEMMRVADLQYNSLHQERTKDFALTTKLTMSTDQTKLTTLLAKRGMKLASKQIALGANSATDAELQQAMSTNSLDSTLVAELRQELTTYRTSLREAYGTSQSRSTRALLQQLDANAQLLLAQSQQQ